MPRTVPSYSILTIAAFDFHRLEITSDGQGGYQLTGHYKVRTSPSVAAPDQRGSAVSAPLTAGQVTAIGNVVTALLVPGANTIEGT